MTILAIVSALVSLVFLASLFAVHSYQASGYNKPVNFTFANFAPCFDSRKRTVVDRRLRAVVVPAGFEYPQAQSYTPPINPTMPNPVCTGMDRQVGEALPSVMVDIGIWIEG
jgi:hypothetical protein